MAGHFPNKPIVPGVMILEQVQNSIIRENPKMRINKIIQSKFIEPLLPEQTCHITYMIQDKGKINFQCHVSNKVIASGILSYE